MRKNAPEHDVALNLRPGELVEVRSEEEILATLDANGRLDAQPFMPEMLEYCGKQFKVYKRSDKTCDTISNTGSRRMWNTVHLEDTRCNGAGHDGCQARCLLYWKEAWLKRAKPDASQEKVSATAFGKNSFTRRDLTRATRSEGQGENAGKVIFSCQATEVLRASKPLPWWDPRQYYRDVCWGNAGVSDVARGMFFWAFKKALKIVRYRVLLGVYNRIQKMRGGVPYPFFSGKLSKTPTEELNLHPGEMVQIKSYPEIVATLDGRNKNRGLYFDSEMVPFCGEKHRVLDRVEKIVNEKNGEMSKLPGACIMMEGVICRAWYSDKRIACPRSIYSYWREIWLKRAE
ncbi:MAG: hypothetical protein WBG02_01875 [Candidatus Acidiferrum sp.]